eukprot:scaffold1226_cov250-Pinguiococcus_pyrenoidosus.AAC.6
MTGSGHSRTATRGRKPRESAALIPAASHASRRACTEARSRGFEGTWSAGPAGNPRRRSVMASWTMSQSFSTSSKCRDAGFEVVGADGADAAGVLRDDDIRAELAEQLRVHAIHAEALDDLGLDAVVDFCRRLGRVDRGKGDLRKAQARRRVVAFVGATDEVLLVAQVVDHLRRSRQQGDDARPFTRKGRIHSVDPLVDGLLHGLQLNVRDLKELVSTRHSRAAFGLQCRRQALPVRQDGVSVCLGRVEARRVTEKHDAAPLIQRLVRFPKVPKELPAGKDRAP